jgi:hypothetical protein
MVGFRRFKEARICGRMDSLPCHLCMRQSEIVIRMLAIPAETACRRIMTRLGNTISHRGDQRNRACGLGRGLRFDRVVLLEKLTRTVAVSREPGASYDGF